MAKHSFCDVGALIPTTDCYNKETLSSLQIAEITGKLHEILCNQLETWKRYRCWRKVWVLQIKLSEYKDATLSANKNRMPVYCKQFQQ